MSYAPRWRDVAGGPVACAGLRRVNGSGDGACVDVDASLTIGDLNERPLRDILSSRNALYMGLIEEQQKGNKP